MTRTLALVFTIALVSAWTAHSQSDRSVWEGVYTEEQAARGQTTFGTGCSRCHAPQDFSGETFLMSWENSTALDLLRLLQKTMPMDSPGSLRPEEYTDIVAYFFSLNSFPAGKTELDTNADLLRVIRIQPKK